MTTNAGTDLLARFVDGFEQLKARRSKALRKGALIISAALFLLSGSAGWFVTTSQSNVGGIDIHVPSQVKALFSSNSIDRHPVLAGLTPLSGMLTLVEAWDYEAVDKELSSAEISDHLKHYVLAQIAYNRYVTSKDSPEYAALMFEKLKTDLDIVSKAAFDGLTITESGETLRFISTAAYGDSIPNHLFQSANASPWDVSPKQVAQAMVFVSAFMLVVGGGFLVVGYILHRRINQLRQMSSSLEPGGFEQRRKELRKMHSFGDLDSMHTGQWSVKPVKKLAGNQSVSDRTTTSDTALSLYSMMFIQGAHHYSGGSGGGGDGGGDGD